MKNLKTVQFSWVSPVRKVILVNIVLAMLFLCQPTPAYAGVSVGLSFGGRWHHDRVSVAGYFPLSDYYYAREYYSPYYYPATSYRYIVESAPVGAVVYAIPAGCRQVVINGTAYFDYNGTYYMPVAGGYQVVSPPVLVQPSVVVAAPSVISLSSPTTTTPEEFIVNVPNSQGGYTAVNVKRSGSGFIGPQGEFYNEFPKVQQLRVMYAK